MTQAHTNRPRGRPPLDEAAMLERINIRVPGKIMAAIEEVRDEREDGSDTAQIIREGLVAWLKSIGKMR